MKIQKLRTALATRLWIMAFLLAGCHPAQQPAPANEKAAAETAVQGDEAQRMADAVLGKQAEILAQGDLAQNGRKQLLIVNRLSKGAAADTGAANPSPIFITRAAILEKNGGKWSEILRCDEHLKNPNGYLGGSPAARVAGWQLEFGQDAKKGLEMKFTPEDREAGEEGSGTDEPASRTVVVRWNTRVKRYQSFDRSQERYMSEAPMLETPQSILR